MKDRDSIILAKILQYISEINGTVSRFSLDLDKFKSDYVVKNAIAMCILTIGTLVGEMTDEFRLKHDQLPWKSIVGLRNIAAHAYGSIDTEILWGIVTTNIPDLKAFCESALHEKRNAR